MQYSLFGISEVDEADVSKSTSVFDKSPAQKNRKVNQNKPSSGSSMRGTNIELSTLKQKKLIEQEMPLDNAQENDEGEEITERSKRKQLLKWIGNKQRFASEIVSYFPDNYGTYFEPFLGSGAIWAALEPRNAVISDIFVPLVGIWQMLQYDPETLKRWYRDRWQEMVLGEKVAVYEHIKASYNACPNSADLLFLCRTCYGGVMRFRKRDGYMSTPCGIHKPMSPESFAMRVDQWYPLTKRAKIASMDYSVAMKMAREGDLIYCDPPYTFSQSILYGAQSFSLKQLFDEISQCKARGVKVALSIDGTKRSGNFICDIPIPDGLFEQEILVNCGRSMLKRFQMDGLTLEEEVVADKLLLTY